MVQKALMVLSLAVVVSAVMLSFAVWSAGSSIGSGLAKIQLTAAAPSGTGSGQQLQPTPAPTAAAPTTFDLSATNGKAFLGKADAPLTVVEFSDLQCPFCARFYTDSEPQLIKNYVDTGKIKFVFMQFPLDQIHPNARPVANAALCVLHLSGDAAFWKFHNQAYDNNDVVNVGTLVNDSLYATWAKNAGADGAKFADCYGKKTYDAEVTSDLNLGISQGVQGTPTFFIVDKAGQSTSLVGAQPYAAFQQALDAKLG